MTNLNTNENDVDNLKLDKKIKKLKVENNVKLDAKNEKKSDLIKIKRKLRKQEKKNKFKEAKQKKINLRIKKEEKKSNSLKKNINLVENEKLFTDEYKNKILTLLSNENSSKDKDKFFISGQLYKLFNHCYNNKIVNSVNEILAFLVDILYFDDLKLSCEIKDAYKKTFFKCCSLIFKNSIHNLEKNVLNINIIIIEKLCKNIFLKLSNDKNSKIQNKYNKKNIIEMAKKNILFYKNVKKNIDDKNLNAFYLFNCFINIYYLEKPEKFFDYFNELNECFKNYELVEKQHLFWADVLTDIILSLLASSCVLIKVVCKNVFSLIQNEITEEGLNQLISALLADECLEFENDTEDKFINENNESENIIEDENFTGTESESDNDTNTNTDVKNDNNMYGSKNDSDEEYCDLDIDEDIKDNCCNLDLSILNKIDEQLSEDEEDLSDSEISDNESLESNLSNEEVDEEFKNKLKNVLSIKKDENENEHEENDIVFDDEQMFKLDSAIVDLFKERRKKNKLNDIIEFKLRCLDLVLIMVNSKQLKIPNLIKLSKTILELIKKTSYKKNFDLLMKSSNILKMYPKLNGLKCENLSYDSDKALEDLFNNYFILGSKLPDKIRKNINTFCTWIMNLSILMECKIDWKALINKEIKNFFEKKKEKKLSFFTILIEKNHNLRNEVLISLFNINMKNLNNFKLLSLFKILNNCIVQLTDNDLKDKEIIETLCNSFEKIYSIYDEKKNQRKAILLVKEIVRFFILIAKINFDENTEQGKFIKEKLSELNLNKIKLSKNLKKKWKNMVKKNSN